MQFPTRLFMTDPKVGNPIEAAENLVEGDGIILRHYQDRNRETMANTLSQLCHRKNLFLIIGEDVALAKRVRADAIHMPSWASPQAWAQARLSKLPLTASVHNTGELRKIHHAGAHSILISPVFKTSSHPSCQPLGPFKLSAYIKLASKTKTQCYALGGITSKTVKRLPFGVKGIAGITLFKS